MQRSGLYALLGAFIVTLGLGFLAQQRPSTTPSDKLSVVAGANFWGSLASQIAGDEAVVTSIINDPSADPHLFESDANTAAAVSRADIAVVNGLGYDEFMEKLLDASPNSERTVITAATVFGAAAKDNPHLWYDVTKVPLMITVIEQALAAKDPANAVAYRANAEQLTNELQPLTDVVKQIKAQYSGAPVAYTEPVPAYLLYDAGLTVKTPEGFALAIESGEEPSPKDQQLLKDLISSRSIKILLYNSQAVTSVTEELKEIAVKAGIPVVSITETVPAGEATYQSWQLRQAQAILSALNQSSVQDNVLQR